MSAQPRIFPRMVIHRAGVPIEVTLYRTGLNSAGIEARGAGNSYLLTAEELEQARRLLAVRDEWMAQVTARVEARKRGEEVQP